MGLGLLGRGLGDTLFLVRSGARVTVTDLKNEDELAPSLEKLQGLPVKLKLGGHDEEDFSSADMILKNADVPHSSRFLKIARENGVPVEMDESLFCRHFHGEVVGITEPGERPPHQCLSTESSRHTSPESFWEGTSWATRPFRSWKRPARTIPWCWSFQAGSFGVFTTPDSLRPPRSSPTSIRITQPL